MVEVSIDSRQLAKLTRAVANIQNGVARVLAPAINRALNSGRTTVRREIRKVYLIKQKDIPVAVHGASRQRLSGQIVIRDTMLDASKFIYKPRGIQKRKNKKPLFVQIKKGAGGYVKHAFVAQTGGYTGPFQRTQPERLPIRKLITIGAPIMASQPNVGPAVNKNMGDTLAKRIDHEIKRVMAKGEK